MLYDAAVQEAARQAASTPRSPIRRLEPLLINQIAAGEVIERPASVVKELVENALDAGATRIRVELERGGIDLIRITDDGCGIPPEELELALDQHATSKLPTADTLASVATMGFRGEALASIASVSRMTIRSRTPDSREAWQIDSDGGERDGPRPAAGPVGTCVTVRTLFFNTPARRKFLKTDRSEQGRCADWLRDLAIARPGVAFELVSDGRTVVDLPAEQGPRSRALAILGPELEDQLVEARLDRFDDAHSDGRGISVWGLVGLPSIARATAKSQHVFVNGRAVRDRTIQHALKEAYRGLVEPGRYPTAVLMLEVGPEAVDVNVHPAKLEVRFRDQSAIHSAVLRAVREALRRADLTPSVDRPRWQFGQGFVGRQQILPESAASSFASAFTRPVDEQRTAPLDFQTVKRAIEEAEQQRGPGSPVLPPPVPAEGELVARPTPTPPIVQVHKSYVVTQDEQGLVIIDQHALHERVMFEKLLVRVSEGPLQSQRLLTPIVVPATPTMLEALERCEGLLARIGIEASPLGRDSIGVHAFATLLLERHVECSSFMAELLDRASADDFAPDGEEALRDVLDMMACKAAIKAGDGLSEPELAELLRLREVVERSSNCPHGRPTSVRVTIAQLDRLFGRS